MLTRLRKKATLKTDDRIQLINEIIPAMRVIKIYAWEEPFIKLAQIYRKLEMDLIRRISYYRAFNITLSYISAKLMIFPTLIVVVLTGSELTATKVVSVTLNYRIVNVNCISLFMFSRLSSLLLSLTIFARWFLCLP